MPALTDILQASDGSENLNVTSFFDAETRSIHTFCMTMATSRETEDREYAPLSKIRDNYPKYILTRNDPIQKRDGIIHKNLPQFMAGGTLF